MSFLSPLSRGQNVKRDGALKNKLCIVSTYSTFAMVEFFCKAHPEPGEDYPDDVPGGDGFCRFEKQMK